MALPHIFSVIVHIGQTLSPRMPEIVFNWCSLTHMQQMDFPILIIWMSPLLFLGTSEEIFSFLFHFSMKITIANRIAPNGMLRFAA